MSKIIHCCWFGRGKKSKLIEKCMTSWSIYASDYKVVEWNEDNFDIHMHPYVEEAYKAKKWAFVSDYVRVYALYNYGGIYLDTDVELFKELSPDFLEHEFFSGFELYNGEINPITALMGAKKNSKFVKELLDNYENRSFIKSNGEYDLLTNTRVITDILVNRYDIDPNTDTLQYNDDVCIYPSDYFCNKTSRSYAMHHFDGSWVPQKQKLRKKIINLINRMKS
ncbi:TPA: glycosyltransferase family 32 protein [Photobacterium damselae]